MTIPIKANRAYPSLPAPGSSLEAHTRLLEALKEAVEIHERRIPNAYLDSFVRLRELIELGIMQARGNQIVLSLDAVLPSNVALYDGDVSQFSNGTFADGRIAESNVTQHQAALVIDWSQLTSVPSIFPPGSHTHSASDITTGTLSDARLSSNVALYDGDVGQFTSGTFDDARIAESNVTQHQAALSISWSQLTDVPPIVLESRKIDTGTGLTGGGDLSQDRTIALDATTQSALALATSAVQPGDLAAVAFSGDYDDLSNTPTIPPDVSAATFITASDETSTLSNSRQLVAGANITLDTSTPGQIVISSSASGGGGGQVDEVIGTAGQIDVDNSDPAKPVLSLHSNVLAALGLAGTAVQPGDLADVAFSGDYGDLINIPSTFPPAAHTHSASDITSGTLADARLSSNVALRNAENPCTAQVVITGTHATDTRIRRGDTTGILRLLGGTDASGTTGGHIALFGADFGGARSGGADFNAGTGGIARVQAPSGTVELNADVLDFNGNVDISGTLAVGGAATFSNNVTVSGTITGNGSGLTSLNASNLSSGTVPDARLSDNVARRNAPNTFTSGQQVFGSGNSRSNATRFQRDATSPQLIALWSDATGNFIQSESILTAPKYLIIRATTNDAGDEPQSPSEPAVKIRGRANSDLAVFSDSGITLNGNTDISGTLAVGGAATFDTGSGTPRIRIQRDGTLYTFNVDGGGALRIVRQSGEGVNTVRVDAGFRSGSLTVDGAAGIGGTATFSSNVTLGGTITGNSQVVITGTHATDTRIRRGDTTGILRLLGGTDASGTTGGHIALFGADIGTARANGADINAGAGGTVRVQAPSGTVQLNANDIDINGPVDISGTLSWGGGNPIASSDDVADVDSGSFTATLTGVSGTVQGTVNWVRQGNVVTLYTASAITGTSNASTLVLTGLPTALQPAEDRQVLGAGFRDAGGRVIAVAHVLAADAINNPSGIIAFFNVSTSGNRVIYELGSWTDSGPKGLEAGWSITYIL